MINCKVKKTISGRVLLNISPEATIDKSNTQMSFNDYGEYKTNYQCANNLTHFFHELSPPGCVSPLHFFEHAISGLVPTLNRGLFGLVECRGRTSQNISLINSNVVRSFWHDSFFLGRSLLLTSLGGAQFPTFIEKKTATVSQIFNSCLPGVDNLIYTKPIALSGM
jgi:hypothetical protein